MGRSGRGAQAAPKESPGEGELAFLGKRTAPRAGGTRGYADGPPACRYGHVQSEPDWAPSVGLIAEWRPLPVDDPEENP